ncbi:unnamed protein product [Polarella glacialis]|uniref:Uncharacterized protein n=1 Tax=Polarella glacialis TaxID=89957 RepID=A0A813FUQ1_POLGL|nr:unnamed protein product [Polarella glacialis]
MASGLQNHVNVGFARQLRLVLRTLLFIGSFLSVFWVGLQYWLTNVHLQDTVIINSAGRLRAYTQNIGLVFLSEKYLNATGKDFNLSPAVDSFEIVGSICAGLLGSAEGGAAPEFLDEEVKDQLREWLKRVHLLESMRPLLQSLSTEEMAALTLEVNSVTLAMDSVVEQASVYAQNRVQTLLVINISRAVTLVIWGLATMFIAVRLWNDYLVATAKLVVLTAQHGSLLKSSYDAVIQVSAKAPFDVLEASAQLDHLIGQSMAGQSILKYVPDSTEKQKLQDFLGSWSPLQLGYFTRVKEVCTSIWRDPSLAEDTFRLSAAKVLHTVWHCPRPDGSQRAVEMELSLASFPDPYGHHLLALRQVVWDPPGDPGNGVRRHSFQSGDTMFSVPSPQGRSPQGRSPQGRGTASSPVSLFRQGDARWRTAMDSQNSSQSLRGISVESFGFDRCMPEPAYTLGKSHPSAMRGAVLV